MYYLIIGLFLILVAGAAEGMKDKILFHYERSLLDQWNDDFWNPKNSWLNKYIDRDVRKGESFRGKYFTFTTDGFHLMKFIERWTNYLGIFFIVFSFNNENLFLHLLYTLLFTFIGRSITFNLVWELSFRKVSK